MPTIYTTPPITASATSLSATSGSPPVCTMKEPDPDEGIDNAYCACTSAKSTITAPLISILKPTIYSQSCEYSTWPTTTTFESVKLPGPTTNTRACQVCTPYAINEDNCNTIPNCTPRIAVATITVGSAPVHVGTLTGTALYTSVSDALQSLCPPVTQTTVLTQCSPTGEAIIKGIEYVALGGDLEIGSLIIKAPESGYNQSLLRDGMIRSIALSLQTSATGRNRFNVTYTVEELRRWSMPARLLQRWAPVPVRDWLLGARDHPYPSQETETMCNAAYFHTANYYNSFWREAPRPGPSDYINALVTFDTSNNDDFLYEFLDMLAEGLTLVAPEFAVADVELEEGINALCCLASGDCQRNP